MKPRAIHFPLIDAVRGLACMWVLLFHAAFITGYLTKDGPLQPFLSLAGTAAALFFVLSGYLLYRPFAAANIAGRDAPDSVRFYWGRFLRVVVAYWVALTLVTIVLGTNGIFSWHGLWTYYGFTQIYDPASALNGLPHAWTLCVEITFYALLPVWAFAMRRLLHAGREDGRAMAEIVVLAVLFVLSVAYKAWMLLRVDPATFEGGAALLPLPNYLDAFALGMAMAVLSVWSERRGVLHDLGEFARRHATLIWVAGIALIYAGGLLMGFGGHPGERVSDATFFFRFEFQVVVAALLLVPVAFREAGPGLVPRLLSTRSLTFLGVISYGFYLYHYAVVDLVDRHMTHGLAFGSNARFWACTAIAVPATIAMGALSWYLVERPSLRLKRKLGRGQATPRGTVADPAPRAPVA
jgi:peptidoglycan/LPS O-acetylase OafA/YrhL